jgi:hypothetical protein
VLWWVPTPPGNPAQAQDAHPGRARCRRRAGDRRHAQGSRPPIKKAKTVASLAPATACCRRRQWLPHQAFRWQATQVRPAVHSETAARPEHVGEGHPGADPDGVVGGVDAGVERCGKRFSDRRRVASGEARGPCLRQLATAVVGQWRDRLLILDGRLWRPAARPARLASASTMEDVDVVLCGIGPHVELGCGGERAAWRWASGRGEIRAEADAGSRHGSWSGVSVQSVSRVGLAAEGCFIRCYSGIREKPSLEVIFRRSHSVDSDIIGNNSSAATSLRSSRHLSLSRLGLPRPPRSVASSRLGAPPRPPQSATLATSRSPSLSLSRSVDASTGLAPAASDRPPPSSAGAMAAGGSLFLTHHRGTPSSSSFLG